MRKLKLAAFALCAVFALSAFAGCIIRDSGENDPDKPIPSDPDTLRIFVVNKGYGMDWEKAMCVAFTKKTGIPAAVVSSGTDDNLPGNAVKLGPNQKASDMIDIFFPTENNVFSQLAQTGFIPGYDGKAWADLSDVYESPAEGYKELETNPGLKIKDMVDPAVYDAFTYADGKQYMMGYSTSVTGLLYNKTLWNATNAKPALSSDPLKLPRTTKEMFDLFDRIKGLKAAGTTAAYPLSYSGQHDYTQMLIKPWWAQYDGKVKAYKALEGINSDNGKYEASIFNTNGRLYAFTNVLKMFASGYSDPLDVGKQFDAAQLEFLKGKAFFSCNGDWLEREASKNFNPGEADVAFLGVPVVSEIVNHPVITAHDTLNDVQLSNIIKWIDDGEPAGSKPSVHADTINFLRDARKFNHDSQAFYRVAHVTPYSPRLEQAKDFLKFMYSKQGQEIMMESAFGLMCPIKADVTQFDYYNSPDCTVMAKSKIDVFQNGYVFGKTLSSPMQYLGGLVFERYNNNMPSKFGTTAANVMDSEYKYWNGLWKDTMGLAGVSNG